MNPITTIYDLIPEGHENAIGRAALIRRAIEAGVMNQDEKDKERVLRKLIHEARAAELVICNTGDGFFIPTREDVSFLRHDIKRKRQMAINILLPLRQSEKLLADFEAGRL